MPSTIVDQGPSRETAPGALGPAAPERRGAPASSTDGWLGALERTSRIGTQPHRILPCVIDAMAAAHGGAPALIGEGETFSHRALAARQNRYARWALGQGLGPRDTVCLLMPNCPEYVAIWLGLSRTGVTVALLNTNLAGSSLAHCIDIAAPSHVIVAAELLDAFASAAAHVAARFTLWVHGAGTPHRRIDQSIDTCDEAPLEPHEARPVTLADRALLIYTSGTTGLPKAAGVSHHRIMTWSHWFAGMLATSPADRMYNCLPLYHSVGGVVAVGGVLVGGGSVVVRRRFSATRFWSDVVAHECTLFQYIGELCRYLVGAPPDPQETAHRLRLCVGNGLRGDIWEAFQARFRIPRILEFYAATEGTVSLYNVEGKVGSVGRVPSFMAHRSPAAIVRHDPERGVPVRDAGGLCVRAAPGEAGELIGSLTSDPARAAQRFEGYTSGEDSARKVLRDVFAPGDAWFRTGDLMRQDAKGFYYFVDRIGDTFRWKGENVATTEVAEAVGQAPGVLEAVVYGVSVPGAEGRAGMAAIRVADDFDVGRFRAALAERLPSYARPVFLRLRRELDVTGTFKQTKTSLIDEGFDPDRTDDPLYVDDRLRGTYRRIDAPLMQAIASGALRL